jgi:hypothetical protein
MGLLLLSFFKCAGGPWGKLQEKQLCYVIFRIQNDYFMSYHTMRASITVLEFYYSSYRECSWNLSWLLVIGRRNKVGFTVYGDLRNKRSIDGGMGGCGKTVQVLYAAWKGVAVHFLDGRFRKNVGMYSCHENFE